MKPWRAVIEVVVDLDSTTGVYNMPKDWVEYLKDKLSKPEKRDREYFKRPGQALQLRYSREHYNSEVRHVRTIQPEEVE